MKRFVFPQDPILSLKRQLQRKVQLVVAKSMHEVETIQAVIREHRNRLGNAATEMERDSSSISTSMFRSFQQIQSSILFEKQRLSEAEAKHRELQRHLQNITTEVEALEFLRLQRKTEHQKKIDKHEQELIEESSRVKNMIDQLESAKESSNV